MILGEQAVMLDEKPYILPEVVDMAEFGHPEIGLVSKYLLTHEEWTAFCAATGRTLPDDGGFGRGRIPVANVSPLDMCEYINWLNSVVQVKEMFPDHEDGELTFRELNEKLGLYPDVYKIENNTIYTDARAKGFQMPQVEEWKILMEGVQEQEDEHGFDFIGWSGNNSEGRPHEVGQKAPNKYGLFDIFGLMLEVCWEFANSKN